MRHWSIATLGICALLAPCQHAAALSNFAGRHVYFTFFGSRIKYPIFTKEFKESSSLTRIGGIDQLWLPDKQNSPGFRIGIENLQPNRAGVGVSLTYWRTEFDNQSFLFERSAARRRIAEYRNPTQTLVFLDLNGIYLPWASQWQAWGLYTLVGLVFDYEDFTLEEFSSPLDRIQRLDLQRKDKSGLDLRFGFGFGTRLHLSHRFVLWLEKRWVVGETFSQSRTLEEGGFFSNQKQKTLFAPINSLGLALYF